MIQPIDENQVKHPNSGAIIGYNSTINSGFVNAGTVTESEVLKTLNQNTYERMVLTSGYTEIEYVTGAVEYFAMSGISVGGAAEVVQVVIDFYGFDDEFLYGDTLYLTGESVMINLPNGVGDVLQVRLSTNVPANTTLEIGVVMAGQALRMQQPIYGGHSPINLSGVTKYESKKTVNGNFIGRTIEQQGGASVFSWQHLSSDWYRSTFQSFVEHAKSKPFFIKWRPDYHDDEVAYVWTTKDIKPVNMGMATTLMRVSVQVESYGGI